MKDTELCKMLNIANSNLTMWKKAPADDWRAIIYHYFSLKTVEELQPEIDRIKKILEIREEGKK
jgi:hypothetical protein